MSITPSLAGFFISLLFGAVVLAGLAGFFIYASQADRLRRAGRR